LQAKACRKNDELKQEKSTQTVVLSTHYNHHAVFTEAKEIKPAPNVERMISSLDCGAGAQAILDGWSRRQKLLHGGAGSGA